MCSAFGTWSALIAPHENRVSLAGERLFGEPPRPRNATRELLASHPVHEVASHVSSWAAAHDRVEVHLVNASRAFTERVVADHQVCTGHGARFRECHVFDPKRLEIALG